MKNAMVDLETLGTENGCVFLSVAAVEFETDGSIVTGKEFYQNVTLSSAMKAGLTVDAHTLQWWLTQKPEVMQLMFEEPSDLEIVLDNFKEFKAVNEFTHLWGNSASFDLGILKAGYKALGKSVPWSHRYEVCYRTVRTLCPLPKEIKPVVDKQQAHNPLYDCYHQISVLNQIQKFYGINF